MVLVYFDFGKAEVPNRASMFRVTLDTRQQWQLRSVPYSTYWIYIAENSTLQQIFTCKTKQQLLLELWSALSEADGSRYVLPSERSAIFFKSE
jgi:hypothetical protein